MTGGKSVECVQDVERTYRDVELVENKVSVGIIVMFNLCLFYLFIFYFLFFITYH